VLFLNGTEFATHSCHFRPQECQCLSGCLGLALDPKINVRLACAPHARQTERLDPWPAPFNLFQRRGNARLGQLERQEGMLHTDGLMLKMTIAGIERPLHHWPGHDRKAWHKGMIFNEKTRYFVI